MAADTLNTSHSAAAAANATAAAFRGTTLTTQQKEDDNYERIRQNVVRLNLAHQDHHNLMTPFANFKSVIGLKNELISKLKEDLLPLLLTEKHAGIEVLDALALRHNTVCADLHNMFILAKRSLKSETLTTGAAAVSLSAMQSAQEKDANYTRIRQNALALHLPNEQYSDLINTFAIFQQSLDEQLSHKEQLLLLLPEQKDIAEKVLKQFALLQESVRTDFNDLFLSAKQKLESST